MAGIDNLYVDRSNKTTYFNEEPGINTCLKCIYLEEYLQVVLSELDWQLNFYMRILIRLVQ